MKNPDIQTGCGSLQPVFLALLILVLGFLSGCASKNQPGLTLESCDKEVSSIATIQGSGKLSPLTGTTHTVRGVVTHIAADTGLYLQQLMADTRPETSDGIYVDSAAITKLAKPGDLLQISGTVAELGRSGGNTLTSIVQVSGYQICARQQPLPVSAVQLPLSASKRESLEAMRLDILQELTVTDVYHLQKRQQLGLVSGGQLFAPTEIMAPGPATRELGQKYRERILIAQLPQATQSQVGDVVYSISGVLTQLFGSYQILSDVGLELTARPTTPLPEKADRLRLMSFNLYNYFNGDGKQSGFPTPRGAETYAEFIQQTQRLTAAIKASDADLVAFQEMENDGYGETSAIADLTRSLNQAMPGTLWKYAQPVTERNGAGEISVGILYRGKRLEALGPAVSSSAEAFKRLSRQPLAQQFQEKFSGVKFWVTTNHFKSKGGCPDLNTDINANQRDGQACWNTARVEAAEALSGWLNNLRNFSANSKVVILGDLNSYRMEDPIRKLKSKGWVEAVEKYTSAPRFSFIYRGQAGTLDYVFVSPELEPQIDSALIWNINSNVAPEPAAANPRSSDHDPVIIDLDLMIDRTEVL